MMKHWSMMSMVLAAALLLAGCSPVTPTAVPTPAVGSYAAPVQSIQVLVMESYPVQVAAVLRVMLSATCDKVGETPVEYADRTFRITVVAVSPLDHGCAPAIEPVEVRVPLDTRGLAPGDYTVRAGDVSAVFTLK
jgi:inhibitor of cysteine peptidase